VIVDIKRVGKSQFPGDMDKEQVRQFLTRKYSPPSLQQKINDELTRNKNTVTNVNKSLADKAGQFISDKLYDSGLVSDRYGAQRIGNNLSALGEMLPVVGDIAAGDDFGRAVADGDALGAGIASLGAIPIVGDTTKQLLRKSKSINLPSGKIGAEEYKIIKQIDPKAKAKANADGSVNVTYLDEYKPKKLKGDLYEFEPDSLELSEGQFKNINTYKGDKNKPISVTKQGGDYVILDGHHRAKIAKQEGRNVRAIVIPIDDVASMQKNNIHQADMRKEWMANKDTK